MSAAVSSLPLDVQGLTIGGAGTWTLVVVVALALIKAWPALRKLQNEADNSLRADMLKRIDDLEKTIKDERTASYNDRIACGERISIMERRLSEERRECDNKLHDMQIQIDGLIRQIALMSTNHVVSIMPSETPETNKAAGRMRNLLNRIEDEP